MNGRLSETCVLKARQYDHLLAVCQFCSLVLSGVAGKVGCSSVVHASRAFTSLLAEHRCLARVIGWREVGAELTLTGIRRTFHTFPNIFVALTRIATILSKACFLVTEELTLLANRGVLRRRIGQYTSRLVPVFLFYYSLFKMVTSAALLHAAQRISFEATDTQSVARRRRYKEVLFAFVEGVATMIYAMTFLPIDSPYLPQALSERYWLNRFVAVISSLCPQPIQVSSIMQGIIGLFSTVPTLLHSS